MVGKKNFGIGDLIWAKMKGFPFWPGKIAMPPKDARSTKKAQHYVFFFGTENYAWILDENIVHHSKKMVQSASTKKKSNFLKAAIEKIAEKAPKKAKSLVKEKKSKVSSGTGRNIAKSLVKEKKSKVSSGTGRNIAKPLVKENKYPKKSSEVPASSTGRKILKAQRNKSKTENLNVQKKIAPKKRVLDESSNGISSPPPKLSRKAEDFSELINNTPPNINYNRVAIIRPLDEHANGSSEIPKPVPRPLNLREANENVTAKNVKPINMQIGFIGLGMIGQRLVKNLLTTGHKVMVWNRTLGKCDEFVTAGASFALTPAELVEKCDIIFSCVSGPEASKAVVFGPCGILSGLEKSLPGSKGYVEMTIMDPPTSVLISESVAIKGGRYLEAPFSGSIKMAEDGALIILAAGDPELCSACFSCFYAFSKHAYYLNSEVGSGSQMTLILSMLIGISNAALAEAMALVERCDLLQVDFLEILGLLTLNTTVFAEKGQAIQSRRFVTDSSLKYQQKDLNLALSIGDMHEQPMPVTTAANELYKRAKRNYSDHDVSAVFMSVKH